MFIGSRMIVNGWNRDIINDEWSVLLYTSINDLYVRLVAGTSKTLSLLRYKFSEQRIKWTRKRD